MKVNNPLYVIVRFDIVKEETPSLTALIRNFFEKEVKRFPGFISFKLHSSEDGTVIINYASWESMEAFKKFMAFASMSEISKKIQAYHPQSDLVYEIQI